MIRVSTALVLLFAWPATAARCQNNALDLRLVEINSAHDVTYQNFIFARTFSGGRFLVQANYLRLPRDHYNEVAAAVGIRAAVIGDVFAYVLAGFGSATDANYAEPALLLQDATGRLTGSLYVQRYQPLDDAGVGQWLLDTFEMQYVVRGPFALGAALYAYQPEGGKWLTKLGPKIGVNDKHGTTELRVTRVSQSGGHEIQLRRVFVF